MNPERPHATGWTLDTWQCSGVERDSRAKRIARIFPDFRSVNLRPPNLSRIYTFAHRAIDNVELAVVGPVRERLGRKLDAHARGTSNRPRVAPFSRDEARATMLSLLRQAANNLMLDLEFFDEPRGQVWACSPK